MPALRNYRQERFCQLWKQGYSRRAAYPLAGYKPDDGAPYRLSANVRVKQRMDELTKSLATKTRVTVESITADLDRIAAGAERCEQFAAAKGAVDSKAKLHGLMVDRKETGGPGEFAGLTSAADVLALVKAELGDATAAALAKALGSLELEALPVPLPTVDTAPRDHDETLN